jgi:hypothetical protein
MAMREREREMGWGPTDRPVDSVDDCTKGCHIRGLPTGSVRVAYVNYREKRKCRVYQVSPTGCTLI